MKAWYRLFVVCQIVLVLGHTRVAGQEKNTIAVSMDSVVTVFKPRRLIIPAALLTYTAATFAIPAFKEISSSTRDEILEDRPGRTRLDDYAQYIPGALFYLYNATGKGSSHSLMRGTGIYATALALTACIVVPAKHLVSEERPDQSNHRSFPSGHTATAFASAQFLFREYADVSLPLALSGYVFAGFTGVYRTINNKHWVHDVTAGAAVGILATEGAYLLYPVIAGLFKGKSKAITVLPAVTGNTVMVVARLQL